LIAKPHCRIRSRFESGVQRVPLANAGTVPMHGVLHTDRGVPAQTVAPTFDSPTFTTVKNAAQSPRAIDVQSTVDTNTSNHE